MIFVICMIEDDIDKNSILIFKHTNHINQINRSSDKLAQQIASAICSLIIKSGKSPEII